LRRIASKIVGVDKPIPPQLRPSQRPAAKTRARFGSLTRGKLAAFFAFGDCLRGFGFDGYLDASAFFELHLIAVGRRLTNFQSAGSRCRRAALSTPIFASSGRLRLRDGMILSTVPYVAVFDRTGIRPLSRVRSIVLADLAMRGSAISFLTLARNASPGSLPAVLAFLGSMLPSSQLDAGQTAPFRTLVEFPADFL